MLMFAMDYSKTLIFVSIILFMGIATGCSVSLSEPLSLASPLSGANISEMSDVTIGEIIKLENQSVTISQ